MIKETDVANAIETNMPFFKTAILKTFENYTFQRILLSTFENYTFQRILIMK
jgi:hypothetical protein